MTHVSVSKFAAMHGVSKQAAAKWKTRGLLVLIDGKVDVSASNEKLKLLRTGGISDFVPVVDRGLSVVTFDNRQPDDDGLSIRSGESAAHAAERILIARGDEMSIDEAKRMKENYLALLSQLDYDQKSGLVVLVADVAKAVGEEYAKVRTRLLAIPAEQAPRINRLKSVTEVQDMLQELITEALEELTRDGVT